jgi:hypothetical protein
VAKIEIGKDKAFETEKDLTSLYRERANISRKYFVAISVLFGVLAIIIVYMIRPQLIDISILIIAVVTSYASSLIYYFIYSKTAEEMILQDIGHQVSQREIDRSTELFHRGFRLTSLSQYLYTINTI